MSNVAGKAYGINVLTPMNPGRASFGGLLRFAATVLFGASGGRKTWANRVIFMAARALPTTLSGLLGLSIIHFARWVIIERDQWPDLGQGPQKLQHDYMMFCSNFNGTWDQYIDAFSDGIPDGLDLFWYSSRHYPHSIPITPFKSYIVHNQIDTGYYYNATPGSSQREIKAALRVRRALLALQQAHGRPGFAEAYRKALISVQNDLGTPGFAPVASMDTLNSSRNRQPLVDERWGGTTRA